MATIPPLPRGVAAYVRAFDLTSIAITRDGRLVVSRNPAGAEAAWWCPATDASRLVRHARKIGGDVESAAFALGVPATAHHVAVQRAAAAVERIDAALAEAQRCGALRFFNAEYRRRRKAASTSGHGFMTYGRARARLRQAVAGVIAAGGAISTSLVAQVFE
jgi:hypothetical protein